MSWRTLHDTGYQFSIDYPSEYVQVEPRAFSEQRPKPLHKVAFLDRQLAQSATAAFQPPNALIEVFSKASGQPLSQWIAAHEPRATLTVVRVDDLQGYRATLPILLAPNEFVYFDNDLYVYRLALLGEHAERILSSFRIIN